MFLDEVRRLLIDVLCLSGEQTRMDSATPLLGSLSELDSMAVVNVIGALEEQFGIRVEDDEISARTFATLGTLAAFVAAKVA